MSVPEIVIVRRCAECGEDAFYTFSGRDLCEPCMLEAELFSKHPGIGSLEDCLYAFNDEGDDVYIGNQYGRGVSVGSYKPMNPEDRRGKYRYRCYDEDRRDFADDSGRNITLATTKYHAVAFILRHWATRLTG